MLDVRDFTCADGRKVAGDAVHDDTTGIQRAIDALRADPAGVLTAEAGGRGGQIRFPPGSYRITEPLRIPSGVILTGEHAASRLRLVGSRGPALALVPGSTGYVDGVIVERLALVTDEADAIGIQQVREGSPATIVVGCIFRELLLSAGGWALRLDGAYAQNNLVDNLRIRGMGAGAVKLAGNANRVRAVNTEAGTRPGFSERCQPAVVTVTGDGNEVSDCILEGVSAPHQAVAFYMSGWASSFRNNWAEMPGRDGLLYVFENFTGRIDFPHHLTSAGRIAFRNARAVVDVLDINGEDADLASMLDLDPQSFVDVRLVLARRDAGLLDHRRLRIGTVVGMMESRPVPNLPALESVLPNGDLRDGFVGWTLNWSEGAAASMSVERSPHGGRRIRVTVSRLPPEGQVYLGVHLAVPPHLQGRPVIVRWRWDALDNHAMKLWPYFPDAGLGSARAQGAVTATVVPPPLEGSALTWVVLGGSGSVALQDVSAQVSV